MKYILLLISMVPGLVLANPYSILYAQAVSGRHDLQDSDSLMINMGIGYSVRGIFIEWDAGINAEVPFQDIFTIEDNQQKLQMEISTGYLLKMASEHYVKLGIGSRAAIFDKNCYQYLGETYCERKEEYGPTYKVGYLYRPDAKLYLGIELHSDELSDERKFGAVSFSVNSYF